VIGWEQRCTCTRYVQDDRARLEEHHIIVAITWHLAKWLERAVGRREFFFLRDESDLIWNPGLL
jgi:hypothetical protein